MIAFACKFTDPTLSPDEKDALLPRQQSSLASGFDLASSHKDNLILKPQSSVLVNTGVAISIPSEYEAQVRSRSGLALKHGVVVLNSPGTIDADYRGEIKVILFNHSTKDFVISFGMRIAQLVIAPVIRPTVQVVMQLDDSLRNDNGFGSTGFTNITTNV